MGPWLEQKTQLCLQDMELHMLGDRDAVMCMSIPFVAHPLILLSLPSQLLLPAKGLQTLPFCLCLPLATALLVPQAASLHMHVQADTSADEDAATLVQRKGTRYRYSCRCRRKKHPQTEIPCGEGLQARTCLHPDAVHTARTYLLLLFSSESLCLLLCPPPLFLLGQSPGLLCCLRRCAKPLLLF